MTSAIAPGSIPGPALLVGSLLFSAMLTLLAIRYAMHRQLLDLPGHRRSHAVPTPRGGGIAPVLVLLVGGAWLGYQDASAMPSLIACGCGLALVAGIGWIDDHRPLPATWRLAVHAIAAIVASLALGGVPRTIPDVLFAAIATFLITSLVNVWNFMDGIDGIAASQAGLVLIALLAGGWLAGTWLELGWLALVAVAGFLPFNLPRARIFLGDVGSGALGYLIAVLLLRAVVAGAMPWPLALLLVSAFMADAGLTLGQRILQGRAWWRPHREHLYQWLVRRGDSHAQVVCWYALWTLAAATMAVATRRLGIAVGLAVTIGALSSAVLLWIGIRNRLWTRAKQRR